MPLFVMLTRLTEDGRRTIKSKPERIREVNKEIEIMGGKVHAQYATLGHYDFVNIIEASDIEAITRISIELGSRGTVEIATMPAMPVEEFITAVKR